MHHIVRVRLLFITFLLAALGACGGGGGGGGDKVPPAATGSMLIGDVDVDDDGLIEIANLQQLDWIRNDPTGQSLTDAEGQANARGCPGGGCFGYELVADLDFDTNGDGAMDSRDAYFDREGNGANAGWVPIGKYPYFTAVFDGNDHVIRNLYIDRPDEDNVGLFSYVDASARSLGLRNTRLEGSLMSVTGKQYVGGLVGYVMVYDGEGPSAFAMLNCRSAGRVSGSRSVGGLIGQLYDGSTAATLTLADNISSTDVSGDDLLAGGLVGWVFNNGGSKVDIVDNSATGDVDVPGQGGGLLGSLNSGTGTASLRSNFATGRVSGNGGIGGLIGGVSISGRVEVRNCHASGTVVASGGSGGLIGGVENGGTLLVQESYATGDVESGMTGFTGGLIGSITEHSGSRGSFSILASYATGAVGTVAAPATQSFFLGGLVGYTRGNSLHVADSYASGAVNGSYGIGGLIGHISDDEGTIASTGDLAITATIENTYASGAATGKTEVGGLVGEIVAFYPSNLSIINTFAVGSVSGSDVLNPVVQGLIGSISNGPNLAVRNIKSNHFATDTTGQTSGTPIFVPTDEMIGALLAEMQCPTAANDMGCAVDELYRDWDQAIDAQGNALWSFGSTAQLPGLRIGDSIHRPAYDIDKGAFVVEQESL